MFYCEECGLARGWPLGLFSSYGRCEVCGKQRTCSDVPSKYLPVPFEEDEEDDEDEDDD